MAAGSRGIVDALEAGLSGHGLCLRGWVFPDTAASPRLITGGAAVAIGLIGHAGGGFWPVFKTWRTSNPGIADPLDTWSKGVITPLAASLGAEAVFPSDRPWRPFQQWAMAAEGLKPSPLGILIHADYGLWHGYRGAILFGQEALSDLGSSDAADGSAFRSMASAHPCDACADKPCLSGCPVAAFDADGFDNVSCRAHLKTVAGRQGCMSSGCRARNACPVGRDHRYSDQQIRFHMAAFE